MLEKLKETLDKIENKGIKRKNVEIQRFIKSYGAGDGNRTHVISLEGWSSTIELHPQFVDN